MRLTDDASTVFLRHQAFVNAGCSESISEYRVSDGMRQITSTHVERFGEEDKEARMGLRRDVNVPGRETTNFTRGK